MEIGIPRADLRYAVLAHEDGGVSIMENIAGKMRQLRNDFCGDLGVSIGGSKHGQSR